MKAREEPAITPGARVIELSRIKTPPVLDGKMDDACWREIKPITGFLAYQTDKPAELPSVAHVAYDDSYLYIGIKCMTRKGARPVGRFRHHDSNVFHDDVVEIMIDPGYTKANYYQLAINAYGATFDCSRGAGGAHEDDLWDGDWTGKSHIGDGYWSAEMAVPFHNLGIKPGMGSTWGLNLCREAQNPTGLSSIAINGEFNFADKFAVLRGLNVDFSKYLFELGPEVVLVDLPPGDAEAVLMMPVRNLSSSRRAVKIDVVRKTADGKEEVESQSVSLDRKETTFVTLDAMAVVPAAGDVKNVYTVEAPPRSRKVVVSRAEDGTILSVAVVKKISLVWDAMRIRVSDPWGPGASSRRTTRISVSARANFSRKVLRGMTLQANLHARDTGRIVAAETVVGPGPDQKMRIDTRDVPWGAYEVRVTLKDAGGREIASAVSPVTVLPGGEQRVKVLNNFVSELMNAGERGLLKEKAIPFMNPRDGWCFFSVTGDARVTVDAETRPVVVSRSGSEATEAMGRLAAGRHVLHVAGRPAQIIVRSIPALQHAFYNANPHIRPYGPYDWEFLAKDVRPNVNVMISSGKPDPKHIQQWTESGRSWIGITNIFIPDFDPGAPNAVDVCYKHWSASPGYQHPLMDGVIVDEFGGGDAIEYDVYRKAVARLNADFKGRIYMPYGGRFYGKDRSREFARAAIAGGGCVCPEHYLSEKATESLAWDLIKSRLVRPVPLWEEGLPGSTRRMIIVLGYMSQPTESLNVNPTVDFKVFMDMQMRTLATHPDLFGLGGVQEYHSSYCDEENVRWAGRLYRHYCIEGKTEPLTRDPYRLTHIRNPDFSDGTDGWTIEAAGPGSVRTDEHRGYSWLEGRYHRTPLGDTFLVTKRSADKPNVFSQTVKGLTPGRLYSMKMITADYQDLIQEKSAKKQNAVTIALDNAHVLSGPKKSFQFTFPNCYAHHLGKFNAKYKYWMNYHWRVFRAKGKTATLTVSDWASDPSTGSGQAKPGGPVGQELMFNFIEIQPYLED